MGNVTISKSKAKWDPKLKVKEINLTWDAMRTWREDTVIYLASRALTSA